MTTKTAAEHRSTNLRRFGEPSVDRRPRPRLRWGAGVMGAALALAIGTAIPLSLAFTHRVAGPVVATPGRVTVSIGAGNYAAQHSDT